MIIGLVNAQGQAFSFIHKGGGYRKISSNNYHFSIFNPCPIGPVNRPARACVARADYHSRMPGWHLGRVKC